MGDEVSADAPVSMKLADVYSELFPLMKEDREFFGLVDSKGTTLQAMYHSQEGNYWFEVPRPDLEGFSGFEFNSW
jgi:hypothetical protein